MADRRISKLELRIHIDNIKRKSVSSPLQNLEAGHWQVTPSNALNSSKNGAKHFGDENFFGSGAPEAIEEDPSNIIDFDDVEPESKTRPTTTTTATTTTTTKKKATKTTTTATTTTTTTTTKTKTQDDNGQKIKRKSTMGITPIAYIVSFQIGKCTYVSKGQGYVTVKVYYGGTKDDPKVQCKLQRTKSSGSGTITRYEDRFDFVFKTPPTAAEIEIVYKKSSPIATIPLELRWGKSDEWGWQKGQEFKKDWSAEGKVKGTLDYQFCCRKLDNTMSDIRIFNYASARCLLVAIINDAKGFKTLDKNKMSAVEVRFGVKRFATRKTSGTATWKQRCHFWVRESHIEDGESAVGFNVKQGTELFGEGKAKFSFFTSGGPESGHSENAAWVKITNKKGKEVGQLKILLRFFSRQRLESKYCRRLMKCFKELAGQPQDSPLTRVDATYFLGMFGTVPNTGVNYIVDQLSGSANEIDCDDLLQFLAEARGFVSVGVPSYVLNHPARIYASGNFIQQGLVQGQEMSTCRILGKTGCKREPIPNYIVAALTAIFQNPESYVLHGELNELFKDMSKTNVLFGEKDDEKLEQRAIQQVLQVYMMDTSIASQYKSFRDFFVRKIKRVIYDADDDSKVCSPADCRAVAFQTLEGAARTWLKATKFNLGKLLGKFSGKYAKQFEQGSICFCRLNPADSHRWYLPISGCLQETLEIEGSLFPDFPEATHNNEVDVFMNNKRVISVITTKNFGTVILAAIGSTFVGSVEILQKQKSSYKKGTEHGMFNHGGSTIILLFEPNAIQFQKDLLDNTKVNFETYCEYGQTIGSAV